MNADQPNRSDRQHTGPSNGPDEFDHRDPFQHDRDRVLYSAEFRRLAEVTQVLSPENQRVVHNRLTHTLEVAQIGRSIAGKILHIDKPDPELLASAGGLDETVVETAALVHDIGHPPFGHITEETLSNLLHEQLGPRNGFDGNAQSFRIITKIATHSHDYLGLDLTRASLSAILKYPWLERFGDKPQRKWGVFPEEVLDFRFAREHLPEAWEEPDKVWTPNGTFRTLEAEIMDWSDDIAYAVHDMEDFYKAGLIPLDRLATDNAELDRFVKYHTGLRNGVLPDDLDLAKSIFQKASVIKSRYDHSLQAKVDLRNYSNFTISSAIAAPKLVSSNSDLRGWELSIDPVIKAQVSLMKSLLNYYVLEQPSLQSVRHGYVQLIRELFRILMDIASGRKGRISIFPKNVSDALNQGDFAIRVVTDFISGLTDRQVIAYYRRLTGISFGDSFDVIV